MNYISLNCMTAIVRCVTSSILNSMLKIWLTIPVRDFKSAKIFNGSLTNALIRFG